MRFIVATLTDQVPAEASVLRVQYLSTLIGHYARSEEASENSTCSVSDAQLIS